MSQQKTESAPVASGRDVSSGRKFCIRIGDKCVAGFAKLGGIKLATDVVACSVPDYADAPARIPDQGSYEAIVFERGAIHDSEFEQWASQGAEDRDQPCRDLVLEVLTGDGEVAVTYTLFACRPAACVVAGSTDVNEHGSGVAVQFLKLQNEGWERRSLSGVVEDPESAD